MLRSLFPSANLSPDEGGVAALMREVDWERTSLGPPAGWPQPLKTLVEMMLGANQPMFVAWGPERTLLYNDAYVGLMGTKHPAGIARPFLGVWAEAAEELQPLLDRVAAGTPVHADDITLFLNRGSDGLQEAHFAFSYTPVRDETGTVAGFFCACVETTGQVLVAREREAALDALSASERNYRNAVDLSPQTIWTAGPDGLLDHVGQRWQDWTGSTGLGTSWGDVLHPDDLQPSIDAWTHSLRTGEPYNIEHRARMRDGSHRWMHSRAYASRDAAGAITRWYGTTEDIDDVRRAEDARRESEERLRLVVDNATDYAIITMDAERRVTSWSAGAEAIYGWAAEEALGRAGDFIFTPEDIAAGRPQHEVGAALGAGCANDQRWHMRKDGTRVFMNGSVRPLPPGSDGAPAGLVKIARDETEQRRAADALAESEGRFRNMADHAPVMMWVTDASGFCTYLNKRWYDFTGQTREEAEGYGWLDATHGDDKAMAEAEFLAANAERRPFRVEYRLRRADGQYRWAIDAASPRFGAQGEYLGYVGSVIDIDERREVELALSDRERRLRSAVEVAALGTWEWDLSTGAVNLDARARAMFGFSLHEDIDADEVFARIAEDDRARVMAESVFAAENATRLETEYDVLQPDGTHRSIASVGELMPGGDGAKTRMSGTFLDITERRAARRALEQLNATLEERVAVAVAEREQANALYQGYFQHSAEALFVMDVDDEGRFRVAEINPAHEAATGFNNADARGRDLATLLPPDAYDQVVRYYRRAIETGEVQHYQDEFRMNGKARHWDTVLVPVRGPGGRVIRLIGSSRDKTAQVRAEDALRQAQKMEAVGQLTGGIAHDFNNLLTGIVGSLELLKRRLGEGRHDALGKYADVAMASSQRAAALTQRLLAFSRRQPLDPKTVEANRLIASMEDLLRRTLGPQVELELDLTDGLWPTLCDPNQLESAILNLAINARDAMPDGGCLTVETKNRRLDEDRARSQADDVEPGPYVEISVADTGTGIDPDLVTRIFEPFFTTKPIGQGTGLGLSQLYGFVKQSGGHVALTTEPGRGTTFCLYLPRHLGVAAAEDGLRDEVAPQPARDGETVLVVEDEAAVRMLITETLGELGYQAVEAVDGPGGLRELQGKRRLDLLVTDVGLPGLNGRQLADAARTLRPELKVLFITGFAGTAAVGNGPLEPGMEMMTKPFAMDQLATKIRAMIEG